MSIAAAHIWHKPSSSSRAAWMRRFVIVSDSAIRIYTKRDDHEQHKDPIYYIELLTTTDLLNGSDNILFQGWMNKKGKLYWNSRWCALVKYGYLNYVDAENKRNIKSIDISKSKFILSTDKHNAIQWKSDKGELYQFRCDSPSLQKKWHSEMLKIQRNCIKIRKANQEFDNKKYQSKEPTLFAFMIRKPIKINVLNEAKEDNIDMNQYEEHFFCTDSNAKLEQWRICLIEQIEASKNVSTRSRTQSKTLRNRLEQQKRKKSQKMQTQTHKNTAVDILYQSLSSKHNRPHKKSMNDDEYIDEYYEHMASTEIDEKMNELIKTLKIPQSARGKMLSLDRNHKIQMLQQHALKQIEKKKESGKNWSNKFASYSKINISILQQFSVVLRDESDAFLKDFIENMGLNHLCRLATKTLSTRKNKRYTNNNFDIELLRVFKAIIDANEYALSALVKHNHSIRTIVEQIDSKDIRISELALSLLVTLVGIENENDEISILASNKILTSLKDLASCKGQRNRYKVLISHMSVKDVLSGSYQYDTYAVTLINYLIMGLDEIHLRMEQRRLLNALQFEKILNKLEDRTRRKYNVNIALSDALLNQIETYRKLYETDKRNANDQNVVFDEDFDIDNPMDLFKRVHDQALNDGYINELVSILKNLIVLPSNAHHAWLNVSKIVNSACKPAQKELITKSSLPVQKHKMTDVGLSVYGKHQNINDLNKNYVSEITVYPTYQELYTMLEVREAQNVSSGTESKMDDTNTQILNALNEARDKQLKLEDALLEEKSKNLSFQTQLQHLKKHGSVHVSAPQTTTKTNTFTAEKKEETKEDNKATAPVVDDGLNKYRKMLKFKMPKVSILNKMRQDGVDKSIITQFEESDVLPGGNTVAGSNSDTKPEKHTPHKPKTATTALTAEEEQKLAKYKKMGKVNMPKQSIINRMRQDGISPELIGKLYPETISGKKNKKTAEKKAKLPANLKAKQIIKPKNKMRNLHWTKVNPFDISTTIWNDIDDETIQFNSNELEVKFCWKQIESKEKEKKNVKTKNDIVHVLDTRRAYNIEIFLGRLKMDSWTLREALLSMNETKLSLDTVHKLINFVPTSEEAQQLNGYENEKNLGVAENFVKIIRSVDTNLVERLILWEFAMEFNDLYRHEEESLIYLRKAHHSVSKSKSLKLIFRLILKIGNYMNGSTNKGQAYGFKLASLSQLMRSRTTDNSSTLMEYLYEIICLDTEDNDFRECLDFLSDLQALEHATFVDITTLRANIAGIGRKLRMIKKRIESKGVERMGDNFIKMMKPFHFESVKRFSTLEKQRDLIFNDLKDLGVWLNEAKDPNFKYLKILNQFRLDFLNAIKITKQKKEKLLQIEKRKKWKENKNKNKSKRKVIKSGDDNSNNMDEKKEEKEAKGFNENISDVVMQSLGRGTSITFIERLQARARNASILTNSYKVNKPFV